MTASPCIDENAALDFVQGRLTPEQAARIDEHADGCLTCRKVIDAAVYAFRERTTTGADLRGTEITRFARGDVLADRYRIVRFIARGGMGEIYEAEDEILGTRIAVKTIAATIADNPEATRRLNQEVNLARRITHPNVCRIFDLGVHGASGSNPGVRFITMELIHGVSLAQRLKEQGRFSPEAALPIVTAMAAAIDAAHRAGVVHRDFKTDNVMLATDDRGGERIIVTDFGLARNTAHGTHDSIAGRGLEGTLAYMAPEQLEGRSARQPADIYALGLVMYEMLTGELPFAPAPNGAWLAAAWRRAVEPIPPVQSVVPGIDARWSDAIARCLQKEVERRPASAEEVVRALTSGVAAPAPAPPDPRRSSTEEPPAAEVVPMRAPRRGWPAALLAGAAVAGVLIVLAVGTRRHRPHASAATIPAVSESAAAVVPPAPAPVVVTPPSVPAPAPAEARPEEHPAAPHPVARRPSARRPAHQPEAAAPPPPPAPAEKPAPGHRRSADPDDGFIFK